MEITDPIKKVISTVLKKYNQPFESEFAEFIKHVMNGKYEDEEVVSRIELIKLEGLE
jgi:hypothetical protein